MDGRIYNTLNMYNGLVSYEDFSTFLPLHWRKDKRHRGIKIARFATSN